MGGDLSDRDSYSENDLSVFDAIFRLAESKILEEIGAVMAWPCWHRWAKWEKYELKYVFVPGRNAPEKVQGKELNCMDLRQKRCCEKCGRWQDELLREGN